MTGLRVLSFNIHGGRSRDGQRDLGRVHDLMERLDIDVGVFQEMETRPSRGGADRDLDRLAGPTRPHRLLGPNMHEAPGWYGNLIVSRFPILRGQHHDLRTHPRHEPRGAVDAVIDTPLGPLRIIGTHLSLSPVERRREAARLLDLIATVERDARAPLLLMGDINEWQRPSRLLRTLNAALTSVPCRATFPSFFPIFRLDRVWHDAPGRTVTARRLADRDTRRLSDHLPVLITVAPSC